MAKLCDEDEVSLRRGERKSEGDGPRVLDRGLVVAERDTVDGEAALRACVEGSSASTQVRSLREEEDRAHELVDERDEAVEVLLGREEEVVLP